MNVKRYIVTYILTNTRICRRILEDTDTDNVSIIVGTSGGNQIKRINREGISTKDHADVDLSFTRNNPEA